MFHKSSSMDCPPRYQDHRLNSEASTTPFYLNHQHNQQQPIYNIYNRHYSMYAADQTNKSRMRAADDFHQKNMESYNCIGVDYPKKQSLCADSMIEQPKKEGLLQSIFRSATNLIGEKLSRGTGSFMMNWTKMNNPLSVTVVSPDFYKTLHAPGVHESINVDSNNLFTNTTITTTTKTAKGPWCCSSGSSNSSCNYNNKDSSDETLASVLYDNEILSGSCKIKLANGSVSGSFISVNDPGDADKRWREYKGMFVDCKEWEKEKERVDQKIVGDNSCIKSSDCVNTSEMRDVDLESIESVVIRDEKDLDTSANFGSTLKLNDDDDEPVILEPIEPKTPPVETHMHEHLNQDEQPATMCAPSSSSVVGLLLANAYNKVINGVADMLQMSSTTPELETSALFSKRAGGCPKPKKVHAISSGRGRGRARSQLRRSGVSQKRHRKERSRYDRSDDIKFDIDHWDEMDNYEDEDETIESMDVCDFGGGIGSIHRRSLTISFEDIKPMKKKQKRRAPSCPSSLSRVSSILSLSEDDESDEDEDCDSDDRDDYEDDDVDSDESSEVGYVQFRCTARSRLTSVSSVDSDDSFCIVFNDNNECKTDVEPEPETELEDEVEAEVDKAEKVADEESDFNMDDWKPSKIRFNLTPTVHKIVHWTYAYRAARRGPWEEMARDRARFRRRIMDLDSVLGPVLAADHRARVWNERFAAAETF